MIRKMEDITVVIGDKVTLLVNENGDELLYNKHATDADILKKFIDLSVENAKESEIITNPNIRFTIHLDNGHKIYTNDKTIYKYWSDSNEHENVRVIRAIGDREDIIYYVKIKMSDVKLIEKKFESTKEEG